MEKTMNFQLVFSMIISMINDNITPVIVFYLKYNDDNQSMYIVYAWTQR